MAYLLPNLIVIALTGVLVIFIFLFTGNRKKKAEAAIRSLADQRGWRYEPFKERLSWGYRLEGGRWTLTTQSESSGTSVEPSQMDVAQSTRLTAPGYALPGRILLISPRTGGRGDTGSPGQNLGELAAKWFLGDRAGRLREIETGQAAFDNRYAVMGENPEAAMALLTAGVRERLLAWKGSAPWIKAAADGLQIELKGRHIQKTDEILALTDLAEAILQDANPSPLRNLKK